MLRLLLLLSWFWFHRMLGLPPPPLLPPPTLPPPLPLPPPPPPLPPPPPPQPPPPLTLPPPPLLLPAVALLVLRDDVFVTSSPALDGDGVSVLGTWMPSLASSLASPGDTGFMNGWFDRGCVSG